VTGSKTAVKHWTSFPPRNITLENVGGDQGQSGETHHVLVTVTDRNGKPVPNAPVTLTETGPGRFQTGPSTNPSSITVFTGADGTVDVELFTQPDESGDETVTATVTGSGPGDECTRAANDPAGAPAGNCSAGPITITWSKTGGGTDQTRPRITSPAVVAKQVGAHNHRISGSGAPGHSLTIYLNGVAKGSKTIDASGHFTFKPFIKKRTTVYVKDTDNGKASNTVTIKVKVEVSLDCSSPRHGVLKCQLDTNPTLKHAVVHYHIALANGNERDVAGETNKHGNDKLKQTHLHKGHVDVSATVDGKKGVATGSGADGTKIK